MWRKRECQQNRLRKKSSHGTSNCMCPYADGETMTNAAQRSARSRLQWRW